MTAGLASALSLSGCSGDVAFNYRLSLSVRVGARTVVGASVRRLRWHQGVKQLGFMDVSHWRTQGEATVVDLGSRGLLIATLAQKLRAPETGRWYIGNGAWSPVPIFTRVLGPEFMRWPEHRNQTIALLPHELPLLVTFRDPDVPHSVLEVPPDDLAESFGSGVALGPATVEIAGVRRTRGVIDRELPWLGEVGGSHLPGARIPARTIYDRLSKRDFKLAN